MVYVDEMKLTLGTIMMIGQDLGVENKYDIMDADSIDKYTDEVMGYLYKETYKIQEEDWYNIRENYLDEIIRKIREEED